MSRSKSLGVFVTSHFFSLLLIALLVALSPVAKAQSTAVLRGSVIDPSGAAVAHAKLWSGIKRREPSGIMNRIPTDFLSYQRFHRAHMQSR